MDVLITEHFNSDRREVLVACSVPFCPAHEGATATTEEDAVTALNQEFPPPTTH